MWLKLDLNCSAPGSPLPALPATESRFSLGLLALCPQNAPQAFTPAVQPHLSMDHLERLRLFSEGTGVSPGLWPWAGGGGSLGMQRQEGMD